MHDLRKSDLGGVGMTPELRASLLTSAVLLVLFLLLVWGLRG